MPHTPVDEEVLCRWLVNRGRGLVCAHDPTGHLLLVNPAAAASLDRPIDDLIGVNLADLLHPSVRHQFDDYLLRVRTHGHDRGLMRLVRGDGRSLVWAYDNVLHQGGAEGEAVLGHAHDVTAAQDHPGLPASDHLRSLFSQTSMGIGRVDFEREPTLDLTDQVLLDHLRRHGAIGECNPAFARMYGSDRPQNLIGTPIRNLPLFADTENVESLLEFLRGGLSSKDLIAREKTPAGGQRRMLVNLVGIVEERSIAGLWCVQRPFPAA